ncbi:AbrB/MazE/SpoVT family DNA-binding domain-containing protein [Nocardioides sp. zg-ZUI104]|nr:AbrB/MazE/SpoVT family DNA-binding domain-containing protein [Nocardioides faecalis]
MNGSALPPHEGRFAATLTIGAKGQIVIPKGARDLFGYKPGDQVLLLADVERGIVLLPASALEALIPPATGPGEAGGGDA